MKKIKYLVFGFLSIITVSCEENFLEPLPESAISSIGYFQNDEEIESGIIGMYDAIQGVNSNNLDDNFSIQREYYLTEMRSDNTRTKSSEGEAAQFESYTVTASNGIVANYYISFYEIIYRANLVLENLEAASAEKSASFEAEAKFVRAYAYFNLVRLYGDVPLIDKLIGPLEKEVAYTRVSSDEIYGLIISDLETAIQNLDNTYVNRASKAAAQTLLAKVYLTQGTNYPEAQMLLESVISSGDYSLEPEFKDVFYNEGNSEVIFAVGYTSDITSDSQNISAEWLNSVGRTSGVNYVTADARVALDAMGGNRTAYSYRQDMAQPTQYQVVKYLPNGDESLGIEPTASNPELAGNDWIVIRYADVLLLHVEAILAGGQETSASAALNSFQKVRDRAGLTDPVTSITKQDLLDERRVELAFENHRFFDLVRFGVAQEVLSAFSNVNGYNFSATDLLLPIPQREINLSNGLMEQNPGY
ncbi:RagB/SusD family nutrient uptake outer membrane protein [Gramella sp. AN32]|uniref:RagB/SusD family nutrient uptake outer membrane protein n=1 Tax=Christiangramia antarctica TaxID=2058158 RepID=A0ABW5XCC7_9FLAO|nr:RagB/SusD family nutrient uptake outer membrane protein [Gramella sp. AN32]MCM4155491.1 RagB/SusD family nutrient uptake outer membrane protein [Gramella sp. AN32]